MRASDAAAARGTGRRCRGGRGCGGFAGVRASAWPLTYRHVERARTRRASRRSAARRAPRAGTCRSRCCCPTGHVFHQLRLDYNRNRSEGQNIFAGVRDVAGEAGIQGASTDPFDWGVPNLSFSSLTSLRDRNPSFRLDQRFTRRRGGDAHAAASTTSASAASSARRASTARRTPTRAAASSSPASTRPASRAAPRSPGTGSDLADFLLGAVAAGLGPVRPRPASRFRGHAWSLFLQDDWRLRGNLTLNLGVRYEYVSPLEERARPPREPRRHARLHGGGARRSPAGRALHGRLPGEPRLTATGTTSRPRIGVAWKPKTDLTVRAGFGVNYNLGAYGGDRPAPGRAAAVRRQQHAARDGDRVARRSPTALTLPGAADHELLRDRQELRARRRCCSGTSTCSASSAATSWSAIGYTGTQGLRPRPAARAQPRPARAAHPGRRALPLGVVGGHVDPARGHAARAQAH